MSIVSHYTDVIASQMHARLAEVQYISATAGGSSNEAGVASLAESLQRFCRSIELCDDYLRGYYGLKIVSPPGPLI